jgi:hypothetical protein
MKPPPRLLDDPSLAADLRTDLERSAATPPTYDVKAGLIGLQAAIIASAAASASAPSTAAAAAHAGGAGTTIAAKAASAGVWSTLAAKVAVTSLVTAAAVTTTVIAWPATRREPAAAPRATAHAPSTSHAAAAPGPAPAPSAPPSNDAPATDSPDVLVRVPESVPARDPLASASASRSRSPSSSDIAPALTPSGIAERVRGSASSDIGGASSLRREIDQLARIKSLVDTDPALAYRLARQGDRDFAHGVLRQEREALAIVALANGDRRPEATRQLRAFVARYPHSPARERLEQILGTAAGE